MLVGQYEAQLLDKNRIAVPKKFRVELGERLIIARWYEECLVVVSLELWQLLISRLTGKSQMITQSVRDTDRFILGSAYEVEPDNQGRIVLSQSLIQFAKLKDEAVFLGLGDRIEIWDKKSWLKREEYIAEKAGELVEKMAHDNKEADNA